MIKQKLFKDFLVDGVEDFLEALAMAQQEDPSL